MGSASASHKTSSGIRCIVYFVCSVTNRAVRFVAGCCLLWTGAAAAQPDMDIVCPCRVSLGSDGLTLTLGLRNDGDEAATSIAVEASVWQPDTAAHHAYIWKLGTGTLDGVEVPANSTVPAATYAIDRGEIVDDGQHSLQLRLFSTDGVLLSGSVWTHPVDLSMSASLIANESATNHEP